MLAGTLAVVLATVIMYGSNRVGTNKLARWYFAYFSIAMGLWAILISVYVLNTNSPAAEWVVRGYYIAAAALVHGFVLFCMQLEPKLVAIDTKGLGAAFAFMALMAFTPGLLLDLTSSGDVVLHTAPYALYSLYFLVTYVIAMIILRATYKYANTKVKRQQRGALLLATGVAFPAGAFFNLILPWFGNYELIVVGPIFVLAIVLIVSYSILRHGLFDIRAATVRSVGYVASMISFVLLYFVAAYMVSWVVLGRETTHEAFTTPLNIILALLLALVFQPIKSFFDRATDHVFYRSQYDSDEFITELGDALTSTVNLRPMLEKASSVIASTLRASSVTFIIHREGRSDMVITSGRKLAMSRDDIKHLQTYIGSVDGPIVDIAEAESYTDDQVLRQLVKRRYSLILSLGDSIGLVLIRERLGGSYSERDRRVLTAISNELAIAIQNARSVEGIRELNSTLQQRIDEATKELRQSNQQLKKLDQVKDEFVSMASHQLRTPLTSVKGYISMVLEGDVGKITPQQEKVLNEAFISSERMVRLIGDFLNVSRLQTGRFVIDDELIDLSAVVAEEVDSIRSMAKSHGQDIEYHAPKDQLMVRIDEDKTRQVIMNLIDNAIYYSPEAKAITVKLQVEKDQAVFEVHDRGIGVPKSRQGQLFTKFFRADNARKQRPDGTGIGLYLARRVIEAQGGEMVFHSRVGMGSVFGFKLPLDK